MKYNRRVIYRKEGDHYDARIVTRDFAGSGVDYMELFRKNYPHTGILMEIVVCSSPSSISLSPYVEPHALIETSLGEVEMVPATHILFLEKQTTQNANTAQNSVKVTIKEFKDEQFTYVLSEPLIINGEFIRWGYDKNNRSIARVKIMNNRFVQGKIDKNVFMRLESKYCNGEVLEFEPNQLQFMV